LHYSLAATESQAASTQHQFERARQALTLEVVQAYYGALLQQQGIAVAEEGLRRAEIQQRLAQTRFDAAARPGWTWSGLKWKSRMPKAVLIRARSASATALQALRAVHVTRRSRAIVPDGFPGRRDVCAGQRRARRRIAPARRHQGAVRRARKRGADEKAAGADLKPTVAFTGSLQYQQDGLTQFWNGDNRSFQAGLAIRMPLFSAPEGCRAEGPPPPRASSRRRTRSTPRWTRRVWS
jgi:outer membrane protein TolC